IPARRVTVAPDPRSRTARLTGDNAPRSRPRLVHRPRHTSAPGGTRLHIREDPVLSESADGGVFGHLVQGAPGRIRTCAHGSGGRVKTLKRCRSERPQGVIGVVASTYSPRPAD